MRASYTLPVTCFVYTKGRHLDREAATVLANSIKVVLGTQVLTGKRPSGWAGHVALRRPDDTFVRVGPGEHGNVEADMVFL